MALLAPKIKIWIQLSPNSEIFSGARCLYLGLSCHIYIHTLCLLAGKALVSSLHILCRHLTRAFVAWQSNNYRNLMCSLIYTAILYSLFYIDFVVGDVCPVVQSTRTTIFRDILWVHIDRTLQTTARLHASSCILWINHWFRWTKFWA